MIGWLGWETNLEYRKVGLKESNKILEGRFLGLVLGHKHRSYHAEDAWPHPHSMVIRSLWPKGKESHTSGYQRSNMEKILPINKARISHCRGPHLKSRTPAFHFILLLLVSLPFLLSFMHFTSTTFSLLVSSVIHLYNPVPLSFS